MNKIFVNTDGGSRGNPGPAAIGVVFFDASGKEIHSYKSCIGRATNNEAEYQAIIKALEILLKSKWFSENNIAEKEVVCRLDSQLVVEQINGNYKIKQDHIKLLVAQLRQMISQMDLNISFVHIPREENKIADKLVNQALDEK
ncbi:ribonuclease H [Candidatus Berkelbacteria bacterium CG08_land_8_20_14_0_20_39_8]|uniref:Ribonuclease H n=1 Tax=Candidatus Berkelbacteria bacterium CG08_land_8_20_14_0_20_39_8 TaxID=1974511 RepID=A0A2M6YCE9_9BACT|nr:MAG: ribonuclease H [Candidatus Berkelbacteria bacterium CG08_land_8_20_14_0_20_39_8]